jgi:hypothetical protein
MNALTPRPTAGAVLSVHRTSQGLVRYRWWPGWISVELLRDEPPPLLAAVARTDRGSRS